VCARHILMQLCFCLLRAVTDPRDGRRVALKKLPNVFQSLVSSKRVFRELKMLCFFKHENVSTCRRGQHTGPPKLLGGGGVTLFVAIGSYSWQPIFFLFLLIN
jgi:hypothetical protein